MTDNFKFDHARGSTQAATSRSQSEANINAANDIRQISDLLADLTSDVPSNHNQLLHESTALRDDHAELSIKAARLTSNMAAKADSGRSYGSTTFGAGPSAVQGDVVHSHILG